jgi:CheY-like chemotaxis protein
MSYILDGLDVSCQMAEDPELKGVQVILATSLTGAKENGLLTKDEHIPVDEWLSKPVDPEKLLLRVDGVLS